VVVGRAVHPPSGIEVPPDPDPEIQADPRPSGPVRIHVVTAGRAVERRRLPAFDLQGAVVAGSRFRLAEQVDPRLTPAGQGEPEIQFAVLIWDKIEGGGKHNGPWSGLSGFGILAKG
jgi:hypothetical protein